MDIPMMEEHEWGQISPYLENMVLKIKEYRTSHNCDLATARSGVLDLACEKYNEITGFNETNGLALWHHRLSDWGAECKNCGQLFRTPKAKFCANCGTTNEYDT
jgi:hypothetical protein